MQLETVDGYLDCAIDGAADRVATLLSELAGFGLEGFTVDVETPTEGEVLSSHLAGRVRVDVSPDE